MAIPPPPPPPPMGPEPAPLGHAAIDRPISPREQAGLSSVRTNTSDTHPPAPSLNTKMHYETLPFATPLQPSGVSLDLRWVGRGVSEKDDRADGMSQKSARSPPPPPPHPQPPPDWKQPALLGYAYVVLVNTPREYRPASCLCVCFLRGAARLNRQGPGVPWVDLLTTRALVAVEPRRPPETSVGTETTFRLDHCSASWSRIST